MGDNSKLRFKVNVVSTSYGGQVTKEVIKKEVEVPFMPVDNMIYIDGDREYRVCRPEFLPNEWDEQAKVVVFGCWLPNITPPDKQSYLNDGWELEE